MIQQIFFWMMIRQNYIERKFIYLFHYFYNFKIINHLIRPQFDHWSDSIGLGEALPFFVLWDGLIFKTMLRTPGLFTTPLGMREPRNSPALPSIIRERAGGSLNQFSGFHRMRYD